MEPRTQQRLLLVVGLLLLLYGIWHIKVTRYWYTGAGEGKMYRVDRWTGEIYFVEGSWAERVRIPR